jgi:hypothetical protein
MRARKSAIPSDPLDQARHRRGRGGTRHELDRDRSPSRGVVGLWFGGPSQASGRPVTPRCELGLRRSPVPRCLGLVRDAAGSRWRRDNELAVYDLGANRRGSPSAVCLMALCAGRLRGAECQYGDERQEKARADTEPVGAKPHRARMASGDSSRIGRPTHLQLRRDLFSVTSSAKAGRCSATKCYVGSAKLAGVMR